ncbi:MAG: hydantoinase B/oxoprolinase family protein [Phycisphaeraceae bacterium]|nr:hydantoinase B/oxoprolinase family protein [Phycisphaeraceae bacterium]
MTSTATVPPAAHADPTEIRAARPRRWRISVDTGGTFTDCVAVDPAGRVETFKVLSTAALRARLIPRSDGAAGLADAWWSDRLPVLAGLPLYRPDGSAVIGRIDPAAPGGISGAAVRRPASGRDAGDVVEIRAPVPAPLLAVHCATRTPLGAAPPPLDLRLATTRATNALLERRGACTALVTTRGFADILAIGDQRRPALFEPFLPPPAPLPAHVAEIRGRADSAGGIIEPIDPAEVRAVAQALRAAGVTAVCVSLLHGIRAPGLEAEVCGLLRSHGFDPVVSAAEIAPLTGLLGRTEGGVVEAYLRPVLASFLADVARGTDRLHVLTSSAALRPWRRLAATDALLSGPAGGVLGVGMIAQSEGFATAIGFDMGGTSTDVVRWSGEPEIRPEHTVAGLRVARPALAIETVAAGGGSLCTLREDRPEVGPHSAGACPGPACYGAGGPLTLTDVNLLLGRLEPGEFALPVSETAARAALAAVARERIDDAGEALLEGFVELANERMAAAIERISVRRGFDPRASALVAFGGAGGQHACAVADRLGMRTVLVPSAASVLSAVGLGTARAERRSVRAVSLPLARMAVEGAGLFAAPEAEARADLRADGVVEARMMPVRRRIAVRLEGGDEPIGLAWRPGADPVRAFHRAYRRIFGEPPPARGLEVIRLEVVVRERAPRRRRRPSGHGDGTAPVRDASHGVSRRLRLAGRVVEASVRRGESIAAGDRVDGPALITAAGTSLLVPVGWHATRTPAGTIRADRDVAGAPPVSAGLARRADPVARAIFAARLEHIALEMGELLRRLALSTNIRERLDFSCAVLTADGALLVNAPHVPVHLGALGVCVRTVNGVLSLGPGDIAVVNHPAFGGSHLPDVTVLAPVCVRQERVAWVACRAHHAEIGGRTPGSMPPTARVLADEGVVIPPTRCARAGRVDLRAIDAGLRRGPFPSRSPAENLADLRAQIAAIRLGIGAAERFASEIGAATFMERAADQLDRAEDAAGRALKGLEGYAGAAEETFDDGARIAVTVRVESGHATIDLRGSTPPHPGNLNAAPAVVSGAVLYVLRLVAGQDLPLSEGLLRRVHVLADPSIVAPPLSADPAACHAVAGGNVETSQRLANALVRAFGLAAASQGTMNNVLFGGAAAVGDARCHYETIGGGGGAGDGHAGVHGRHVHMTNTRITDPEVLAARFPVEIESFAIRRGSGGKGRWPGGDGLRRVYRFLAPMTLSLLTQDRVRGPAGAAGGASGAPGSQRIIRSGGTIEPLAWCTVVEVGAGDRLEVATPGGGGWGVPVGA